MRVTWKKLSLLRSSACVTKLYVAMYFFISSSRSIWRYWKKKKKKKKINEIAQTSDTWLGWAGVLEVPADRWRASSWWKTWADAEWSCGVLNNLKGILHIRSDTAHPHRKMTKHISTAYRWCWCRRRRGSRRWNTRSNGTSPEPWRGIRRSRTESWRIRGTEEEIPSSIYAAADAFYLGKHRAKWLTG